MNIDVYGIKLTADITDLTKGVDKAKGKVKELEEKTKIKINNPFENNFDFKGKFKNLGLDELNKKLKETENQLEKLFNKAYKDMYNEITGVHDIMPIGTTKELDEYKEKLAEVMELRDELSSKNKTSTMTADEKQNYVKDLERQQEEAQRLNMTVGQVKTRIIELTSYKRKLENQPMLSDSEKLKLEDTIRRLNEYTAILEKLGVEIPKIQTPFDNKTNEDAKEMNNELEKTDSKLKIISSTSISFGNNMSKTFTRGLKSLRRFALSLFGIQSIWSVLSRATHTYMNQNTELSNKIQAVWNGLGAMVGPIVDYLATVFMKLLGYINVVTKALFGFDIIAKANEATMKNYNKQLAKTQKQLGGFDELSNLNQNQEQEGPKGLINEDDIKLDEGLVKKLQDISYWLKDNWDWLGKVLIALGAVFGISAVAGWISNIGKLLGGTSSGLIGFSSVLSTIATLGIITVGVDLVYKGLTGRDLVKDITDILDGINDLRKANKNQQKVDKTNHKNTLDNADAMDILSKEYNTGSKEVTTYVANIESAIEMNQANINQNEKWENSLSGVGKIISNIDGSLNEHRQSTKMSKEEIERLVVSYSNLYNRGQLTVAQTKDYAELMKSLGYNIDGTKMNTQDYNRYLKEQEENQKRVNDATSAGAGILRATGTVLDDLKNKAYIYGNALGQLAGNPYLITINSVLNPPDTRAYINALNDVIWRLNQNDAARMIATGSAIGSLTTMALNRIPYLSIGTDLVRSEGLAYLHAGESVVPADVAGGGYSNDNNETNSLLRELIETVQSKQFSATIGEDEVGRASVNYIRNQNRIMGGSVL